MFRLLGLFLVLVFAVACGAPTATESGTASTPSGPTTTASPRPGTGDSTAPGPTLTPVPGSPVTTVPPTAPPSGPSLEPPSPPPGSSSPPPSAKPPQSGLIRVKGEIREGVEAGCTVLHTADRTFQLVAPRSMDLPRDRVVTVLGRLRPEMMSYCQQGAMLEVKQIWVTDQPRG